VNKADGGSSEYKPRLSASASGLSSIFANAQTAPVNDPAQLVLPPPNPCPP